LNVGSEGSIGCNISLHKKIISTTSVSAFCDDEITRGALCRVNVFKV
jgi:hypothetical protein